MSTYVAVNTHTHSITHVTGEMVRSLKQIVRLSGLSTEHLMDTWSSLETAISTWLRSQHLKKVTLEIYDPKTDGLQLIVPPFGGGYKYEIKSFISSAQQQIANVWPDPAKLGPAVSEQMTPTKVATARTLLTKIARSIDKAMLAEKQGRVGDALTIWRDEVFGPMFPLS